LVGLLSASTACLTASLLQLHRPLILGFLFVIGELHLFSSHFLIVKIASISALHLLELAGEHVLGVVDRVKHGGSNCEFDLLDIVLFGEHDRVHGIPDVTNDIGQNSDDRSVLLAKNRS